MPGEKKSLPQGSRATAPSRETPFSTVSNFPSGWVWIVPRDEPGEKHTRLLLSVTDENWRSRCDCCKISVSLEGSLIGFS
mmetsp:Transcript_4759/g.13336  ORF Transcript_4759/g.13336 Transcript_4759/m.13336 type:complete len:80 (+) Transcript_4759:439-678(+)